MEEGVGRMRTNLAERRIGYEPPEVPEGESLEERRERIRAIYQWRKAMRRLARLGAERNRSKDRSCVCPRAHLR